MSTPQKALIGLLKLTGLRQLEVARHLQVSRSCLAGWLAGYTPIPDAAVLTIHRLVSERLNHLDTAACAEPGACRAQETSCPAHQEES